RAATLALFASAAPITIVPLDVAGRFRFGPADLAALPGPIGAHLRAGSRRWILRNRLLLRRSFAMWDLLAAMWLIEPEALSSRRTSARAHRNGWIEIDRGGREVTLVTGFDRDRLWQRFV